MPKPPTIAELIQEYERKVQGRCPPCGQWTLYKVDTFSVCTRCDTAIEDWRVV